MDYKIKHLDMVSTVIQRMSKNSFLLKGWCITLSCAIIALTQNSILDKHAYIFYIVAIMFWFLDAYYLQIERRYVDLYDKVRIQSNECIDFNMKVSTAPNKKCKYIRCLLSINEAGFYVAIIAMITFINGLSIKKIIIYLLTIAFTTPVVFLIFVGLLSLLFLFFRLPIIRKIIEYFYIILKYTGLSLILDIFSCILASICELFAYKRINPFFIYNKSKKRITQALSFKGLWMGMTKKYYMNKDILLKDLCTVDKKIIQEIAAQGLVINFNTNKLIFLNFNRILKENSIKVQILEDTKIEKANQKFERISLITSRDLIKSSINKVSKTKLKDFLNKPLDIKNYYIKFKIN